MLAIWQQLEVRQLKSDLNQTQSALREYWGLQAKQDSINQIKVKINDNHKNK